MEFNAFAKFLSGALCSCQEALVVTGSVVSWDKRSSEVKAGHGDTRVYLTCCPIQRVPRVMLFFIVAAFF